MHSIRTCSQLDNVGIKGRRAEQQKWTNLKKRFEVPDSAPFDFQPLAVETFGRFGPNANAFIKAIARRAHPPQQSAQGEDFDVDGLMARYTNRLRARIQLR